MKIDLSYKCNYEIVPLEAINTDNRYYYPGANTEGGRDGVVIEITPSYGKKWIGIFAFGEISNNSITGIYSTPDPDKFCVVAKGKGYIVSSNDPKKWEEINVIPIMDVQPIKTKNILIFADYTSLTAYETTGIKWHTERLFYDGFKIIEVTEQSIKGEFWDIRSEKNEIFEINPENGESIK